MEKKKITKEEYKLQKQWYEESRDKIYENHPQVRKFETSKKRWILFLLLYGLLLTLAKLYVLSEVLGISILLFISSITSFAPILIFLLCALGQWKQALPLYLLSTLSLVQLVYLFFNGEFSSLNHFVQTFIGGFLEYPIQTSLDFLSLAYSVLILITAIHLTLFRKNRELSVQSALLLSQVKEAVAARIVRDRL